MEALLQLKGIDKAFPGVKALSGAALNVYPGRVMAGERNDIYRAEIFPGSRDWDYPSGTEPDPAVDHCRKHFPRS